MRCVGLFDSKQFETIANPLIRGMRGREEAIRLVVGRKAMKSATTCHHTIIIVKYKPNICTLTTNEPALYTFPTESNHSLISWCDSYVYKCGLSTVVLCYHRSTTIQSIWLFQNLVTLEIGKFNDTNTLIEWAADLKLWISSAAGTDNILNLTLAKQFFSKDNDNGFGFWQEWAANTKNHWPLRR